MTITQKRRRSALEAFDGCPYKYDQVYNRGVEDKGDESQRGLAIHEVIFQYIRLLAAAKLTADADVAAQAFQIGIALAQMPVHLLSEVTKIWGRFREWFQLDLDAYLSAEDLMETDRFTWIPDLVYVRPQGVEIIDWKSYFKGLTQAQARKEFQLKFYLLMAVDVWPNFPSYTFTFNFVRLGYQVSVTMTAEEIEAFRPEVEAILLTLEEAERTNNYPAIPGSHCTLCRLACPLVDTPAKLPIRFTEAEQAKTAAGEILVLEQRLKTLKKALGGWVNQEGPLVVNGQLFNYRETISRTYPATTVLNLVERHYGEDADGLRHLTFSTTAVKKVDPLKSIQGHPDLVAVERQEHRWAFVHSKAGAIGDADQPDDEDDEGGE